MTRALKLLPVVGLLAVLSACSGASKPPCGPANCLGCCDADGACQLGAVPSACGTAGGSCNACPSNWTCQLGQCFPSGGTCTPYTCVGLAKNCGEVDDGCGGRLNCGTCETPGESCGAGGTANVCAQGTCSPGTCESLGAACGQVSDGCGALLACGTCQSGFQCSSQHACEPVACTPSTCQQLGKNCGVVSDTCGGQLDCGACSVSGETCGGGGVANVCGRGACTPRTCQQAGASCGSVADGCGNMLSCGSCTAPATCGGGGVPNACGSPCPASCPAGFTCQPGSGVCAGGNLASVVLDVPVPAQYTVAGRVTRNGAVPVATYGCYQGDSLAELSFEHTSDTRFNTSTFVSCTASGPGNFAFSAPMYPGTYKVTVRRPSYNAADTNLPSWSTVASTSFTVNGPVSNAVFDVPVPAQYTVAGRVTRNGQVPVATYGCYQGDSLAELSFEHTSDTRFNTSTFVSCGASGPGNFPFTVALYPGTYKVTVRRPSYNAADTNLPSWSTVASTSFTVSGPVSNAVFDVPVPAQYTVSGRVTRNGQVPVATYGCYQGDSLAELSFEHTSDTRFNTSTFVSCGASGPGNFPFTVALYAGTYKVTVRRPSYNGADTNLPSWSTVASTSFTVSGPVSNAVFDVPVPAQYTVAGRVTRNGQVPVATYGCYQGDSLAELSFEHTSDTRFNTSTFVSCGASGPGNFPFTVALYPGTYKVTVRRPSYNGADTNLPSWSTVASTSFTVSGPVSNAVFDVPVPAQYTVAGRVTRNGQVPVATYGCYQGDSLAELSFEHTTDTRFNTSAFVSCTASGPGNFAFSASMYPGTYKVTVRRPSYNGADTNLPSWSTVASTSFTVSGPVSNAVFDVPVPMQYTVSGRITVNGAVPTATYGCYQGDNLAEIAFEHVTDSRFNTSTFVACGTSGPGNFPFTVALYPGTYKVTVRRPSYNGADTNLPSWSTVVTTALRIP